MRIFCIDHAEHWMHVRPFSNSSTKRIHIYVHVCAYFEILHLFKNMEEFFHLFKKIECTHIVKTMEVCICIKRCMNYFHTYLLHHAVGCMCAFLRIKFIKRVRMYVCMHATIFCLFVHHPIPICNNFVFLKR